MAKINSKNRVTVDMKEEDRVALELAAKARGVTKSEFIRTAVSEAAKRINLVQASADASKKAVEDAFNSLDAQDIKSGLAVAEPEPVKKPSFPVALTRHPCLHLEDNFPAPYRKGEIAGTCRKQGNKPCHFHGQSARSCMVFTPYSTRPNK